MKLIITEPFKRTANKRMNQNQRVQHQPYTLRKYMIQIFILISLRKLNLMIFLVLSILKRFIMKGKISMNLKHPVNYHADRKLIKSGEPNYKFFCVMEQVREQLHGGVWVQTKNGGSRQYIVTNQMRNRLNQSMPLIDDKQKLIEFIKGDCEHWDHCYTTMSALHPEFCVWNDFIQQLFGLSTQKNSKMFFGL